MPQVRFSLCLITFLDEAPHATASSRSYEEMTTVDRLRKWATKTGVPKSAVNELLAALRPDMPDLPKDYRTLLETLRRSYVRDVLVGFPMTVVSSFLGESFEFSTRKNNQRGSQRCLEFAFQSPTGD